MNTLYRLLCTFFFLCVIYFEDCSILEQIEHHPQLIYWLHNIPVYVHDKFIKDFIYFNFRQRGREGEREGEKHQCVVASHAPTPHWGPGLQPRLVP